MTDQQNLPTPDIEGFQIYKTDMPNQKVVRFLTPIGPVQMMATRKWLLDIGRAMIASAEEMPLPS